MLRWPVQVPMVVKEAQAALDAGCAVVIGLQSTGEAAVDAMGVEPGDVCGWVSTTRQLLSRFVAVHFPTHREVPKASAKRAPLAPGHVLQVVLCGQILCAASPRPSLASQTYEFCASVRSFAQACCPVSQQLLFVQRGLQRTRRWTKARRWQTAWR